VMDKLKAWLDSLAERERRMVVWGGIAGGVLLFFGVLVIPLYTSAARADERVTRKTEDLGWMRSVAAEIRAAGPMREAAASGESLVVVVDQTARSAGLGPALRGSQPSGTDGIRVRMEDASFDAFVGWLAQLQQQHRLVVETASIDRTSTAGAVNVTVNFKRPG